MRKPHTQAPSLQNVAGMDIYHTTKSNKSAYGHNLLTVLFVVHTLLLSGVLRNLFPLARSRRREKLLVKLFEAALRTANDPTKHMRKPHIQTLYLLHISSRANLSFAVFKIATVYLQTKRLIFTSISLKLLVLCTYQCNAPLPPSWALQGQGGDLTN